MPKITKGHPVRVGLGGGCCRKVFCIGSACVELRRELLQLFLLLFCQLFRFVLLGLLPEPVAQCIERLLTLLGCNLTCGGAIKVKPGIGLRQHLQVARARRMHPHGRLQLLCIQVGQSFLNRFMDSNRQRQAVMEHLERGGQGLKDRAFHAVGKRGWGFGHVQQLADRLVRRSS